jgi:hypothetical protein
MTPRTRIRHDIGKYVTLQQRFLPADPTVEDLREALVADLGSTHRGPAGTRSIGEVWADLAEERAELAQEPAFDVLDARIAALVAALPDLATATAEEVARVAGLARDAADACRALGRDPG